MSSQGFALRAPRRGSELDDQPFFTGMAFALAAFITFGFAQWALRGFVSVAATPWWVHTHGVFMLLWLAIFVSQNILAGRGAFAQHRQLGWAAMLVVAGTGIFGSVAGIQALAMARRSGREPRQTR